MYLSTILKSSIFSSVLMEKIDVRRSLGNSMVEYWIVKSRGLRDLPEFNTLTHPSSFISYTSREELGTRLRLQLK